MSIGNPQQYTKSREKLRLLVDPREIPVYTGPSSVRPGSKGRDIDYEFQNEEKHAWLQWPKEYLRKYSPLKSPRDNHILTDDEIDRLLNSLREGWNASNFENVEEMVEFLKFREAVPEKVYGLYEQDITICRFFNNKKGDKNENMLADIRRLNEDQKMGNVKIPNTDIEIINYSPCPKCDTPHSFSDVFNYYMHPIPDPQFKDEKEQRALDTRVKCKDCGSYFLPALIITDGNPKNEFQMICRSQTLLEITMFMREEFNIKVLTMKEENIISHPILPNKAAWRNDIDGAKLKIRPALYANLLQYTPAPLMLDFISRRNLTIPEPVYGAWCKKESIRYYSM
jgi:hypothetical protein